jgi:hypothetical protein
LATNYMSQLDPAVRRPGRVGIHLYIGPLNREARWSLAKGRAPSSCLALEKHGASDFLSATKSALFLHLRLRTRKVLMPCGQTSRRRSWINSSLECKLQLASLIWTIISAPSRYSVSLRRT